MMEQDRKQIAEKILSVHPELGNEDGINMILLTYYLRKLNELGLISGGVRTTDKGMNIIPVILDNGWKLSKEDVTELLKVLFEINGQEDIEVTQNTSLVTAFAELVLRLQTLGFAGMKREINI